MEALIALILAIFFIIAAFYAICAVAVMIGAVGWYLSFPILGIITALLVAWPIFSYRSKRAYRIKTGRYVRDFGDEEGEKSVLIGIVLLIIWGCALRDQISALWYKVSPYVLR